MSPGVPLTKAFFHNRTPSSESTPAVSRSFRGRLGSPGVQNKAIDLRDDSFGASDAVARSGGGKRDRGWGVIQASGLLGIPAEHIRHWVAGERGPAGNVTRRDRRYNAIQTGSTRRVIH